jgi:TonB-linked SusC/RagA family outer membrane protein
MKKKLFFYSFFYCRIIFLILIFPVVNSAMLYSQALSSLTESQSVSMREAFRQIEKESDFRFFFNDEFRDLMKVVTYAGYSENINDVLKDLLNDSEVTYQIMEDNVVVITPHVAAEQQQLVRRGRVTDVNGEPLPGVSIVITGTTTGTTTDADGNYSIAIPNEQATLRFSFVGYVARNVPAGTQQVLNLTLEESVVMLEETVVTALGMRRDVRALSYSSAQVSGADIEQSPEINIMNSLEGMVAGVFINNLGTGAAGSSSVSIRGNSSISRGAQPLYIVDGVPIERFSRSERGRDLGDALTMINPNDIESMNILKGAAATALYGSRASNGVILITTKSGRDQEGISVQFNNSIGFENYVNPFRGRQTEYGVSGSMGDNSDIFPLGWNEETHRSWGRRYDGTNIGETNGIYFNNDPTKPIIWSNVGDHWGDFMETGSTINNSLAITGGGTVQRYRVSVSDLRYNSPIPNSDMNRQTVSVSTDARIWNAVTIDGRVGYSTSKSLNRPQPSRYQEYLSMIPTNWPIEWLMGDPTKPGANLDGYMLSASTNDYHPNPYWSAFQDRQTDRRDQISASANTRIDLASWLFLSGRLGISTSNVKNTDISAYGWLRTDNGTGRVDENTSMNTQLNYEGALNFNKDLGLFGVVGMVGGSATRSEFTRDGLTGTTLQIPFYHVITNAGNLSPSMGYSQSGINSVYSSVELSYNSMLYLTATGRNDWFSMLAPGYNSLFYPSLGMSYVFSNHFALPEWMTFGKLRASYAQVGGGAGAYDTKLGYSFNAIGYMDSPLVSIPGTIANPYLQPYLTSEYEVGLDVRFFKNRVGIDYSYYDTETVNDIVTVTLPQSSGYTGSRVNLGAIANKGHEIMLTLVPSAGQFRWQMNMAYAYNISKVLDLGGVDQVNVSSQGVGGNIAIRHVVGEPRNGIYGYKHLKTDDGQPIWQRMSFGYAGQTHYTWRPVRSPDQQLLGYGINPNSASIRNNFSYKRINLSFMIDGKWGAKTVEIPEQAMIERGTSVQTLPGRAEGKLVLQGVYQTGTDAQGNPVYADISTADGYTINANPEMNIPNPIAVAGNEIPYNIKHFEQYYRHYQTRWLPDMVLQDGSFAKFRQLTIGYTLPRSSLSNLPVQSVNISLVGRNLFDIYNKLINGDPSTGSGTGFSNSFPGLRQITMNLNVNF